MRVFKFGGASVKDAKGVKNLTSIVLKSTDKLVVVVSAMGKMTNAFEQMLKAYYNNEDKKWEHFKVIKHFHIDIMDELFDSNDEIHSKIDAIFFKIEDRLNRTPSINYDFEYDQMVGYGEILSTKIINAYIKKAGGKCSWIDIRFILKTNDQWRDAKVEWELTHQLANEMFTFEKDEIYVTQGFVGSTTSDLTTTLGREGSDFTAAIIGSVLNADKVEIWKDVPGILNADPQYFKHTRKIDYMSYREAVELTFFGAKVIHPKTIKPLENNNILLHVCSFLKPESSGTIIGPERHDENKKNIPIYILKNRQVLITVSQPDFSFMDEESLTWIFGIFSDLRMKINMIQNSALNLSVSIDIPEHGILELIERLSEQFEVRYNDGLDLITIRYYTPETINKEISHRTVYLEQKSRRTARYLVISEIKKGS